MVTNVRDPRTRASVHPQYNMLNVVYRLYVQIFERIENGEYPPYISTYIDERKVTTERIRSQQRLIADLIDGLMAKEYTRDPVMTYLRKAMADCRWTERYDWEAMGVFDLLASQSLLAYFFLVFADLAGEDDVQAQNAGELREIVDRMCEKAVLVSTTRGNPDDPAGYPDNTLARNIDSTTKPKTRPNMKPSFETLRCNLCGEPLGNDTGDNDVFFLQEEPKILRVCDACIHDENINPELRICPVCKAYVHAQMIRDNGKCPKCGFIENEHEGSSWI
jgi:hypothetical protein